MSIVVQNQSVGLLFGILASQGKKTIDTILYRFIARIHTHASLIFVIDFHPILPALQPPVVSLPTLTLTISVQLSSLNLVGVNTPLP